jgi:tetratricopeptide (TPR) repeat protein
MIAKGFQRLLIAALAVLSLATGSQFASNAFAQISGIERGGGVDRPYVTVRKRLNNPRVAPRVKPPKGKPAPVDAAMIPISTEAMKHYDAGRKAYDTGNLDTAISEFESAIRLESKFVDALIDLGDAYFDRAELDDAVDMYNDVIKTRPTDPEVIYNIALTNKALKRYDAALPYFQKAIASRTTPFPEARVNVARCYIELGKLPEAEAEARKALDEFGADKPASANAWYTLAAVLVKKPDLPGANDALDHAIGVCKDCPPEMVSRFYLSAGQVYESRGERTRAADSYERFLQLAPFVPDYQVQDIREKIAKLRKGG